ncbi:hypothetical protein T10_5748 [Trichinella papuae]|uniref:Uncharacterized protein n=1 Tax=Trichinella papuae TaxID=268474 RepID=A0A0V1MDE6_9BILA|nr:hypothetical protein T10_5748 [Trichinella papuae]
MKIGGGVRWLVVYMSVGKLPEYILIVCCFIVAMPSGKRETERKGNAPVNTGPSPNSDGRANNLVEEADEPARGSGPLQMQMKTDGNLSVHQRTSRFRSDAEIERKQ